MAPRKRVARFCPRAKPGQNRLIREIKLLQRSFVHLIPRASMACLTREIVHGIKGILRFRVDAIAALHEAAETFIVKLFEEANLLVIHPIRITVSQKDMQLVCMHMERHIYFTHNTPSAVDSEDGSAPAA